MQSRKCAKELLHKTRSESSLCSCVVVASPGTISVFHSSSFFYQAHKWLLVHCLLKMTCSVLSAVRSSAILWFWTAATASAGSAWMPTGRTSAATPVRFADASSLGEPLPQTWPSGTLWRSSRSSRRVQASNRGQQEEKERAKKQDKEGERKKEKGNRRNKKVDTVACMARGWCCTVLWSERPSAWFVRRAENTRGTQ